MECGARNAERGTASLRVATFTRINLSAECGATLARVRSAERGVRNDLISLTLHSQGIILVFLFLPVLSLCKLWFLDVVKCGARNAERGTASLRVATFTRIDFSFFSYFYLC